MKMIMMIMMMMKMMIDDGVVENGTPLHAILFLVYKQPGRWRVRPDNFEWNALCFNVTKYVFLGLTFKEANGAANQNLVCGSPTRWTILLTPQILK